MMKHRRIAILALLLCGMATRVDAAWTLVFHDGFTGTPFEEFDGRVPDTLGTSWINPNGAGVRPTIDTAGTGLRNGGENTAYISDTVADKQAVELTLKNPSSVDDGRLYLRLSWSGGQPTGYALRYRVGGTNTVEISRWDAGSRTLIDSVSLTLSSNDVLRFEADGNSLTALVNGTPVVGLTGLADPGTPITSGTVGLFHSTGADPCGDDFKVYEDTAPPPPPSNRNTMTLLGVGE